MAGRDNIVIDACHVGKAVQAVTEEEWKTLLQANAYKNHSKRTKKPSNFWFTILPPVPNIRASSQKNAS